MRHQACQVRGQRPAVAFGLTNQKVGDSIGRRGGRERHAVRSSCVPTSEQLDNAACSYETSVTIGIGAQE